jgi:nucleotide-binding universal stress UspA family protein
MATNRFVILAAVDSSFASAEVARAAAAQAWMNPGAEVHVVHVVEAAHAVEGNAALDVAYEEVRASTDAKVTSHVSGGEPWREIVQLAVDLEADVVILGTHGRSGIRRLVLGSVAETVVRRAPCPVLVVRKKEHRVEDGPEIEPPCPDCVAARRKAEGATLWCERHAAHHPRGRLHYESPSGFGGGSMLIR